MAIFWCVPYKKSYIFLHALLLSRETIHESMYIDVAPETISQLYDSSIVDQFSQNIFGAPVIQATHAE